MAALAGEYAYGAGPNDRITIATAATGLTFLRKSQTVRNLVHLGDRVFYPVGAPRVQIKFRAGATGVMLSVHDPDLVLEVPKAI